MWSDLMVGRQPRGESTTRIYGTLSSGELRGLACIRRRLQPCRHTSALYQGTGFSRAATRSLSKALDGMRSRSPGGCDMLR